MLNEVDFNHKIELIKICTLEGADCNYCRQLCDPLKLFYFYLVLCHWQMKCCLSFSCVGKTLG